MVVLKCKWTIRRSVSVRKCHLARAGPRERSTCSTAALSRNVARTTNLGGTRTLATVIEMANSIGVKAV